jgi:predicted dehydrogenase
LTNMAPGTEAGWRGQMVQRTLFEAGVHLIDLIMTLFDETPMSVQAATASPADQPQGDAIVLATFEFSRGRLAHLLQNRIGKGETQYFEVRADTGRASFRASFGGRARLSLGLFRSMMPHLRWEFGRSGIAWREEGGRRHQIARNPSNPNVAGTRAVLEDALAAFARNAAPHCDARRGRDVLEVAAACYLSATTGERIALDGSQEPRLRALRMGAIPAVVNG